MIGHMMKTTALIFAGVLALSIANAEDEKKTEKAPDSTASAAGAAPTAAAAKPSTKEKQPANAAKKTSEKVETTVVKTEDSLPHDVKKLVIQDTLQGTGKVAAKGKTVKVNYTGWLYDPAKAMGRGKQFDTSVGSEPFTFELGAGKVIKGWDEGFENMKVGGKRKLIIPAEMGYGARGAGSVIHL